MTRLHRSGEPDEPINTRFLLEFYRKMVRLFEAYPHRDGKEGNVPDISSMTAAVLFDRDLEYLTKEERRFAKEFISYIFFPGYDNEPFIEVDKLTEDYFNERMKGSPVYLEDSVLDAIEEKFLKRDIPIEKSYEKKD